VFAFVVFSCFRFSVLSQEIGWEERLRNDLFSVFCVVWLLLLLEIYYASVCIMTSFDNRQPTDVVCRF